MLRELRQKRTDAIEFVKKLNGKESLSESETKELETRWNEAKDLEKRIGILEATEKMSLQKEPVVPPKEKRSYSLVKAFNLIKDRSRGDTSLKCTKSLKKEGTSHDTKVLQGSRSLFLFGACA